MVRFMISYTLTMEKCSEEKLANSFNNKSSNNVRLGKATLMITNYLDYRRGVEKAVEDFFNVVFIFDPQERPKAFSEKRKLNWK